MVLELLLHPTSEALRRAARQLLERIADSSGYAVACRPPEHNSICCQHT